MADPRDILGNHIDINMHAERQSAYGDSAQVNQPGWDSELFLYVELSLHSEGRQTTTNKSIRKIPRVEVHAGGPSRLGSKFSSAFPQQEIY